MNKVAHEFIKTLVGEGCCTFQTFDETTSKDKKLNKILHGTLDSHLNKLEMLNKVGAGIFLMINAGDLKGRKSKNVKAVRAAFVDLDDAPLAPILGSPLKPHIIVESSPKKYHAYWLVEGIKLEDFKAVQLALAIKFGGDKCVHDLPRVMRIPGFNHNKKESYLTNIIEINHHEKYEAKQFYDTFGIDLNIAKWKTTDAILEGSRNTKLFTMASGFASKGMDYDAIYSRISKINSGRCSPPLPESEINEIIKNSLSYAGTGNLMISYQTYDSDKYKSLSHKAMALDMYARRQAKNNMANTVTLLAKDLKSINLGNPNTLRKCRDELLNTGFLILVSPPQYGRNGLTKTCGIYKLGKP